MACVISAVAVGDPVLQSVGQVLSERMLAQGALVERVKELLVHL